MDFNARWYDPAIGRFTTIDPLAEDYHSQSGFVYAANNPIKYIDFLGLAPEDYPIYGEDGTLIGYVVEEGQGPTQIAQDLNNNYSCELSCDADWTQIVYDNGSEFQNVFDGEGNVTDEFNEDYESGNIQPGTVLEITNGIDQTTLEKQEGELKDNKIDLYKTLSIIKGKEEAIKAFDDLKLDPDERLGADQRIVDYAKDAGPVRELKRNVKKLQRKAKRQVRTQDSLKNEIKKTKGQ